MADEKDVDARFRAIVDAEFGEPTARTRRLGRRTEPMPATRVPADDFNFTEAMDAVEVPRGWSTYTPEPLPPMRPWKLRVAIGAVLMGVGIMVTLLGIFGAEFSQPLVWGGIISAVVGLATLLSSAPRRQRLDPWDDGARV